MDEEANAGDDQQHDERELIKDEGEVDVQRAEVDPVAECLDVGQWAGPVFGSEQT